MQIHTVVDTAVFVSLVASFSSSTAIQLNTNMYILMALLKSWESLNDSSPDFSIVLSSRVSDATPNVTQEGL